MLHLKGYHYRTQLESTCMKVLIDLTVVLCVTAPEGRFAWKNVALLSTCSSSSHVTAHPCEQAVDGIGQHTNGWHAEDGTSVGEWIKVCTDKNDVMTWFNFIWIASSIFIVFHSISYCLHYTDNPLRKVPFIIRTRHAEFQTSLPSERRET